MLGTSNKSVPGQHGHWENHPTKIHGMFQPCLMTPVTSCSSHSEWWRLTNNINLGPSPEMSGFTKNIWTRDWFNIGVAMNKHGRSCFFCRPEKGGCSKPKGRYCYINTQLIGSIERSNITKTKGCECILATVRILESSASCLARILNLSEACLCRQ